MYTVSYVMFWFWSRFITNIYIYIICFCCCVFVRKETQPQHVGTLCLYQMGMLVAVLQLMDLSSTSVEEEGLALRKLVQVSMALSGELSESESSVNVPA